MVSRSTKGLAVLFGVLGTLHFVKPEPFEQIVPKVLPRKKGSRTAKAIAYARLPLQLPLIRCALKAARE
jgi:uncharacterized membrane protein